MTQIKVAYPEGIYQPDFIDLDEILDPYERMQGNYYVVDIVKAEHGSLGSDDPGFIALELVVVERESDYEQKSKFKYLKVQQTLCIRS